ncbi:MAG: uroporphyrinogen decarboxylase [Alphaproteobacteria bacterium]|nr:uroporphyrinogen decarboxylase [Alphaproteobacteria bacterium]
MYKTDKPILGLLSGLQTDRMPVWLMRQAGRYLPEYRALREKAGGFLKLCLTPEWAAEITLQPIRRFQFDAAIIFADILLIPMALGQKLEFREGEGPVLEALKDEKSLAALNYDEKKLFPVFEALSLVKKDLPKETALIGFCGAPWTVACYMIDGTSRNDFHAAKQWAVNNADNLDRLINILVDASELYLSAQIRTGAEIIQIFDSWAGLLDGEMFHRFVVKPTQKLVQRLKEKHLHIPIIGFPRAAGENYRGYAQATGIDALSIDQDIALGYAKELQGIKTLQGNLDPALLVKGGDAMKSGIEAILKTLGPRHIFNLGHGVVPQTPPEHVAELVKIVRSFRV